MSTDETKPRSRPGRKRLGTDVFVPVTMKVEPSELAMIESIAKYSGRSRSDVMREMLSYGLAHMMQRAFGGGDAGAVPAPVQGGNVSGNDEPPSQTAGAAEPDDSPSDLGTSVPSGDQRSTNTASVPDKASDSPKPPLSAKGAAAIVDFAAHNPQATMPQLQKAAGISRSTLIKRVRELSAAGILTNRGTSRHPHWQVADAM